MEEESRGSPTPTPPEVDRQIKIIKNCSLTNSYGSLSMIGHIGIAMVVLGIRLTTGSPSGAEPLDNTVSKE
jgi:hypothetical protein